jgi:hypothetical protein
MAASEVLWPIFIFINYPNLLSLGGIIGLTSLVLIAVVYLVGRMTDSNEDRPYRAGLKLHAVIWPLRLALVAPAGLLASNFLGSASAAMADIPFNKSVYRDVRRTEDPISYLLACEFSLNLGRVAILAVAVAVDNSSWLFILVGILTLGRLLVMPKLGG